MLLAQLSASFQSLPPLPTSKLGPSCTDSQVGGFVCGLGPCGWSPMNCPVRLGVSSATITPTGFFSQGFWGFISPCWNPGLCGLSRFPVVFLNLSGCKCGTSWCASHHLTGSGPPATALPRVLSTPASHLCPSYQSGLMFLLLLLGCRTSIQVDFLAVLIVFCFSICCCLSVGCARRHSVCTFAFILARSPHRLRHFVIAALMDYGHFPVWPLWIVLLWTCVYKNISLLLLGEAPIFWGPTKDFHLAALLLHCWAPALMLLMASKLLGFYFVFCVGFF